MKVSYKREMNHNYLVIEAEYRDDSYEARMMVNNYIEGLLKFRIKKVDVHSYFCYEITSKQPLDRLLESRSLGLVELQMLVVTMARTLNRMEEYLLDENQVLVLPEYIYVEPDLFQIEFCLIPGRQGDFPQEFSRLLEYLLGKVDYQDQDCVVLAYGLYRESLKDNYGMEDLLRFLGNALPTAAAEEMEYGKDGAGKDDGKPEELPAISSGIIPDRPLISGISGDAATEKKGWFCRIKGWMAERFRSGKEGEKKEKSDFSWQMTFEEQEDETPLRESGQALQKENPLLTAEMPSDSPNTVLLAEKKEMPPLRRLMSLEVDEPDICIAYYPFIIGKQESLVDHILNKNTVSRLHMRLDEKDGAYWITDLNSTNGTMVAGRLLENNEIVRVDIGDEVIIAGIRFRFA